MPLKERHHLYQLLLVGHLEGMGRGVREREGRGEGRKLVSVWANTYMYPADIAVVLVLVVMRWRVWRGRGGRW